MDRASKQRHARAHTRTPMPWRVQHTAPRSKKRGIVAPWVKPQNRFFVAMLRNVEGGLLFLAARPSCVLDPPNPAEAN